MAHFFVTSCVNANSGEEINEMQDISIKKELSSRYFIGKIAPALGLKDLHETWGYDSKRQFADDWALHCAASFYQGIPCYFVQHSRIEYIYIDCDHSDELLDREQSAVRNDKISELESAVNEIIEQEAPESEGDFFALAIRFHLKNRDILEAYRIPLSSLAAYRCDHAKAFAKFDRKYYRTGIDPHQKRE